MLGLANTYYYGMHVYITLKLSCVCVRACLCVCVLQVNYLDSNYSMFIVHICAHTLVQPEFGKHMLYEQLSSVPHQYTTLAVVRTRASNVRLTKVNVTTMRYTDTRTLTPSLNHSPAHILIHRYFLSNDVDSHINIHSQMKVLRRMHASRSSSHVIWVTL